MYRIKFFFSFIFLYAIFSISYASSFNGDSLFREGKYFEAAIEYERLIFRSGNVAEINFLRYKKALCYKQLNQFDRALDELQPIYFSNPGDSLYLPVCYEQSLCYYFVGEPARALWKIDEYLHRSNDSTSLNYFATLKILCLNKLHRWEEAENVFLQYVKMQNFSNERKAAYTQIVTSLYDEKYRPRMKSEQKAENFSRFIPGSGQAYAGEFGEGVVNFLMNASVLVFSGYQIYNGFYITGYLAGLGFFNKTYHGGIRRAGVLAVEKNKKEVLEFNKQIVNLIYTDFD